MSESKMTLALEITPAAPCHISAMADRLRTGDLAEIEAAGLRPGRALWRSYRGSIYAKTAFVGGEIAAVWGLSGSPLGMYGQPWLLTTPAAEKAKTEFLRTGRREVATMLSVCPVLLGYVDTNYRKALRLLEKLGFDLEEPLPFGARGALFRRYRIERP